MAVKSETIDGLFGLANSVIRRRDENSDVFLSLLVSRFANEAEMAAAKDGTINDEHMASIYHRFHENNGVAKEAGEGAEVDAFAEDVLDLAAALAQSGVDVNEIAGVIVGKDAPEELMEGVKGAITQSMESIKMDIPVEEIEADSKVEKTALEVGDFVQWESDGEPQFPEPKEIMEIKRAEDGELYAVFDFMNTGVALEDLKAAQVAVDAPDVDKDNSVTGEEVTEGKDLILRFDADGKATLVTKGTINGEPETTEFPAKFKGVKDLGLFGTEKSYVVFSGGAAVKLQNGAPYRVDYAMDADLVAKGEDVVIHAVSIGRDKVSEFGPIGVVEGNIPDDIRAAAAGEEVAKTTSAPEPDPRKARFDKIIERSEKRAKTVMGKTTEIFEGETVWGEVLEGGNTVSIHKNDGFEDREDSRTHAQEVIRDLGSAGLVHGEDFSVKIQHGRATDVVKLEFKGEKASELAAAYSKNLDPEAISDITGERAPQERSEVGAFASAKKDKPILDKQGKERLLVKYGERDKVLQERGMMKSASSKAGGGFIKGIHGSVKGMISEDAGKPAVAAMYVMIPLVAAAVIATGGLLGGVVGGAVSAGTLVSGVAAKGQYDQDRWGVKTAMERWNQTPATQPERG